MPATPITDGEEKILNVLRAIEERFEDRFDGVNERLARIEQLATEICVALKKQQDEKDAEIPF